MAELDRRVKVGNELGTLELFHITWQSTFRGLLDDMYIGTHYELISDKSIINGTSWADLKAEAMAANFTSEGSERYKNYDVGDKYRVHSLIRAQYE